MQTLAPSGSTKSDRFMTYVNAPLMKKVLHYAEKADIGHTALQPNE